MSNINLIIEERPSDIGNFLVGRLLPFREKRMVGPFAFIDHMGPAALSDHENLDVGPHPHIGLSTLTYLFEGSIMHRDSLGTVVEIKPGQVNWMTAGKGIVHSERTPDYLRNSEKMLHGLQIWVALPKHLEDTEPSFAHIEEDEMPVWNIDGVKAKLIAGEAFGKKSPVPVYSPLYFIELKSTEKTTVSIGDSLYGESAIYILEGSIEAEDTTFSPKQLLVAKDTSLCQFTMNENTTIYIFGGEPFAEPRHIYWNFVASTKEAIEDAKERWITQTFPRIPGETGYVPLPEQNTNFKLKK
ncbi:pirin family protein [Flavobacterium salilacus subsp. salilacus]|uniref:pirin family protein n=1 Tax=Flavobacterium TaxID=237 RepID=UPI00107540A3|nr:MULTISPECIES: pirin family protein [Flavobacterium]KAF2519123.1 pirin family protein [Flavobacterium salilacus subsp. salilacus]MBE1613302.1 pirin family protein [Flavobacterium sp. SaA2.13]